MTPLVEQAPLDRDGLKLRAGDVAKFRFDSDELKGQRAYTQNKQQIDNLIPLSSDPEALATDGFRELIFIGPPNTQGLYLQAYAIALWPARSEKLGSQIIRFHAHDYAEVRRAIKGKNKQINPEQDAP